LGYPLCLITVFLFLVARFDFVALYSTSSSSSCLVFKSDVSTTAAAGLYTVIKRRTELITSLLKYGARYRQNRVAPMGQSCRTQQYGSLSADRRAAGFGAHDGGRLTVYSHFSAVLRYPTGGKSAASDQQYSCVSTTVCVCVCVCVCGKI